MKVNIICFDLTGRGGTERAIINLANYLNRESDVSLLLSNNPPDETWLGELNSKIEIKRPITNQKLFKLLLFTKCFFKAKNQDVFIVLGANTVKFAFNIRKILRKRWRIVSWMHFSLVDQDMFDPHNILYADEHLSISNKITKQLIRLGADKRKIHTIYNVIQQHTPLLATEESENHIVFAGRVMLKGQKNLKELFDSFKNIPQNNVLDIYGTGDIEECKKYIRNLGINDRVVWHGWVDSPISKLTSRPKCVVLTSKYEGLPMIFLEAMSYGIPCVSSKFDGYDDVIQEGINGFSYSQGKEKELTQILSGNSLNKISSEKVRDSINKFYEESYFQRIKEVEKEWERGEKR